MLQSSTHITPVDTSSKRKDVTRKTVSRKCKKLNLTQKGQLKESQIQTCWQLAFQQQLDVGVESAAVGCEWHTDVCDVAVLLCLSRPDDCNSSNMSSLCIPSNCMTQQQLYRSLTHAVC